MQMWVLEVKKTAEEAASEDTFKQAYGRAEKAFKEQPTWLTYKVVLLSPTSMQVLKYKRGCSTPLSDGQHFLESSADNPGLKCLIRMFISNPCSNCCSANPNSPVV